MYANVGGHAYGWVYPGPMGSVLTPGLVGMENAKHLPNASTLCGKCETVCPMRIPLPSMLRHWRERQFEAVQTPPVSRYGLKAWAFLARHPALYRLVTGLGVSALATLGARRGRFRRLPFVGGWTTKRDLPAPQGRSFMLQWRQRMAQNQHDKPNAGGKS